MQTIEMASTAALTGDEFHVVASQSTATNATIAATAPSASRVRSCGASGFGTSSPAPRRCLRPSTNVISARPIPTAAAAKPAW